MILYLFEYGRKHLLRPSLLPHEKTEIKDTQLARSWASVRIQIFSLHSTASPLSRGVSMVPLRSSCRGQRNMPCAAAEVKVPGSEGLLPPFWPASSHLSFLHLLCRAYRGFMYSGNLPSSKGGSPLFTQLKKLIWKLAAPPTFFHLSSTVWTSRMTSFVSSSAALWRINCLKNCWSFRKAGGYPWEPPVYTLPLNALSACFQAEGCCQFPCPGKQLMLAWNKQHINHKQKAFPCLHWFLDFVCWIMNAIWAGFCNIAAFLLQYFSFSCPVKSVGPPSPVC